MTTVPYWRKTMYMYMSNETITGTTNRIKFNTKHYQILRNKDHNLILDYLLLACQHSKNLEVLSLKNSLGFPKTQSILKNTEKYKIQDLAKNNFWKQ